MVTVPSTVFESPALPVLIDLTAAGVRFRLHGTQVLVSPRGALSTEQRDVFAQHQDEVRVLVAIVSDAAVQARRDAFRARLHVAPLGTVPALVFVPNVPYVRGTCFSCGDCLPDVRFGRCWRCSLAWRLACGLPIAATLADAFDGAKVVA